MRDRARQHVAAGATARCRLRNGSLSPARRLVVAILIALETNREARCALQHRQAARFCTAWKRLVEISQFALAELEFAGRGIVGGMPGI